MLLVIIIALAATLYLFLSYECFILYQKAYEEAKKQYGQPLNKLVGINMYAWIICRSLFWPIVIMKLLVH